MIGVQIYVCNCNVGVGSKRREERVRAGDMGGPLGPCKLHAVKKYVFHKTEIIIFKTGGQGRNTSGILRLIFGLG